MFVDPWADYEENTIPLDFPSLIVYITIQFIMYTNDNHVIYIQMKAVECYKALI